MNKIFYTVIITIICVFLFCKSSEIVIAVAPRCSGSGSYSYTTASNCNDTGDMYICSNPKAVPHPASYTCSFDGSSCGYYKKDSCQCVDGNKINYCLTHCNVGGVIWTTAGCSLCYPTDGTNGSCGSSDGGTFSTAPASNLCLYGSVGWVDQLGIDGTYNWRCSGSAGSCGGTNGTTVSCSAYSDSAPSLLSTVLKTYDGDTVTAETGSRNQMCQSIFRQDAVNPSGVQFIITATDTQGTADIGTMQIRLRNASNTYTFDPVASVDGVATIPVDLNASNVAAGTYNIEVLINDVNNVVVASWIDTGRDLKNWDCKVAVTGNFYDGSIGNVCPNLSSTLAKDINFTSLSFTSPLAGLSSTMTVNSDSTYNSGSNSLVWGTSGYKAILNNGLEVSDISLRLIDAGVGTTNCNSTLNFNLDASVVDSYANTPGLTADFSGVVSQDSWFQVVNGGILSKSTITNYVPLTCDSSGGCTPGMSIGGLVAAPTINSTTGVSYSSPNDWHVSKNVSNQINYFEKYKKIIGVGTTLIEGDLDDSDVINNTDGLLMVNGNVIISQNKINDWVLNSNYFFMIVASGDITIDPSVSKFDGILAGNNINIGGTSASQLTINGSLYATNKVNITRSYTDKIKNNDSPSTVINFRPSYIFNMPSSMVKSVVDWKWGN